MMKLITGKSRYFLNFFYSDTLCVPKIRNYKIAYPINYEIIIIIIIIINQPQ
jgi:hypothetical protein